MSKWRAIADHLSHRGLICLICRLQLCHRLHVIPSKQFSAWDLLTVQILVLHDTMYVIIIIRRQSNDRVYGQCKSIITSPVWSSPSYIYNFVMEYIFEIFSKWILKYQQILYIFFCQKRSIWTCFELSLVQETSIPGRHRSHRGSLNGSPCFSDFSDSKNLPY